SCSTKKLERDDDSKKSHLWRRTRAAVTRLWITASAPGAEEILQQPGRLGLADAAISFRAVLAGRGGEEPHPALDRAALGVDGAVIDPSDAGERDRRRAHGAGLERDVEIAVGEPLAAERRCRPPDRHHLGMRGRIALGEGAVAGLRDH